MNDNIVILDKTTSRLHNHSSAPIWKGREAPKHVQKEVCDILRKRIKGAGLAQLYALEKKIDRHYNNGTLSAKQYGDLDVLIMQKIAMAEIAKEEGGANV